MARVFREKEMNVSAGKLAAVITDFESYPKFLPEVVGVQRLKGGGKGKERIQFELEIIKRFTYTLEFTVKDDEITWELVDSNFFKMNNGKWVLTPIDTSRTDVRYELEVGFGFFVPGWVSKKLTEVNLPRMMEAFESRALELAKA